MGKQERSCGCARREKHTRLRGDQTEQGNNEVRAHCIWQGCEMGGVVGPLT